MLTPKQQPSFVRRMWRRMNIAAAIIGWATIILLMIGLAHPIKAGSVNWSHDAGAAEYPDVDWRGFRSAGFRYADPVFVRDGNTPSDNPPVLGVVTVRRVENVPGGAPSMIEWNLFYDCASGLVSLLHTMTWASPTAEPEWTGPTTAGLTRHEPLNEAERQFGEFACTERVW